MNRKTTTKKQKKDGYVLLRIDTAETLAAKARRLNLSETEYLDSLILRDLVEDLPITTIVWPQGQARQIDAMARRLGISEDQLVKQAVNTMVQFVTNQPDQASLLTNS